MNGSGKRLADDLLDHINKREKQERVASLSLCAPFLVFVENTGVEPVTSCMPCKRSSQLS